MIAKLENGIIQLFDLDEHKKNLATAYEQRKIELSVQDCIIDAILNKKEDEWTIDEMIKIVHRKELDKSYKEQLDKYSDWLPLVEEKYKGVVPENYFLHPQFRKEDDKIIESYNLEVNISLVKQKIKDLQSELSETDYVIIKTYEAKIIGDKEPYTEEEVKAVVETRRGLRDKINELQALISKS